METPTVKMGTHRRSKGRRREDASDQFLEEFGARLRARRDDLGITQTDLAHRLGVARPTLANFEAGRRSPDLLIVFHCAHHLQTTVAALLGEGTQLRVLDSERAMEHVVEQAVVALRVVLEDQLNRSVQKA